MTRRLRLMVGLTATLLLNGGLPAASPAEFDDAATRPAVDARGAGARAAFDSLYPAYAHRFIPYEGDYACCPPYEAGLPSSRGVTAAEVRRDAPRTFERSGRDGSSGTRRFELPQAEAEAVAMLLPEVAPGQYGWAQACTVVSVLGPEDALVRDLKLLDEAELKRDKAALKADLGDDPDAAQLLELTFREREAAAARQRDKSFAGPIRLRGFRTSGMADKMRWGGPDGRGFQIALVGAGEVGPAAGSASSAKGKRVLEAVAADAFKRGVTREQFEDLLSKRGLSVPAFVELVRNEAQRDGASTRRRVIEELESRKPQRVAATRPDEANATPAPPKPAATTRPARVAATRPAATQSAGTATGWKAQLKASKGTRANPSE